MVGSTGEQQRHLPSHSDSGWHLEMLLVGGVIGLVLVVAALQFVGNEKAGEVSQSEHVVTVTLVRERQAPVVAVVSTKVPTEVVEKVPTVVPIPTETPVSVPTQVPTKSGTEKFVIDLKP